ncbi:hypothetical protein QFZ27_001714 [Inquilinus ginsengisoli]
MICHDTADQKAFGGEDAMRQSRWKHVTRVFSDLPPQALDRGCDSAPGRDP